MVTSVKDSADEISLDGRRNHTTHTCYHRRFTEKSRVGCGKVDFTGTIKGDVKYQIDKKILGNEALPSSN